MTETITVAAPRRRQTAQHAASNNLILNQPNSSNQLALPNIDFPSFKPANYRTWSHMARIFFVQHGLFDIVTGNEPKPAGNVLPKVFNGIVRLADGSTLHGDPMPTWSDEQQRIWD